MLGKSYIALVGVLSSRLLSLPSVSIIADWERFVKYFFNFFQSFFQPWLDFLMHPTGFWSGFYQPLPYCSYSIPQPTAKCNRQNVQNREKIFVQNFQKKLLTKCWKYDIIEKPVRANVHRPPKKKRRLLSSHFFYFFYWNSFCNKNFFCQFQQFIHNW